MSEYLQNSRPCGRLETYSTARHHLGLYNNVGLTASYTASCSWTTSLKDIVFSAFQKVITEHANLCAIPVNEDKSHPDVHFAFLREIDLETCVGFYTRKTPIAWGDGLDDELDQLLHDQHNRNFKGDVEFRPYWRLIICSSPETPATFSASWIFHHALSDGASSMLFHQTFLQGLNAATNHTTVSSPVKTPYSAIQPALEELHPMTLSWPYFLHAIAGSLLPSYFAPRPPLLWTGPPIDATSEMHRTGHTATVFLSAESSTAFANKCRAEKTSMTAALSAVIAAVLSSIVAQGQDLKIDIPISLRPFLAIPETQMVNAITNHTFTCTAIPLIDTNPSSSALDYFSWATAREVKHALIEEVAKKGTDNPIALLKYVSDMQKYFTEKLGGERDSSAEVSNLGVWRDPITTNTATTIEHAADGAHQTRDGEWKIGRMVFSQSPNRTGPPVSLSAVTGADGCLSLSFNWSGDDEGLQRVPSAMKDTIEKLVTQVSDREGQA